jgi:hypothetical protein
MMDMNSTTKRLSYNVPYEMDHLHHLRKDDYDVQVYYVNPNAE